MKKPRCLDILSLTLLAPALLLGEAPRTARRELEPIVQRFDVDPGPEGYSHRVQVPPSPAVQAVGFSATALDLEVRTLQGHGNSVMAVAFSPDGKTLASG